MLHSFVNPTIRPTNSLTRSSQGQMEREKASALPGLDFRSGWYFHEPGTNPAATQPDRPLSNLPNSASLQAFSQPEPTPHALQRKWDCGEKYSDCATRSKHSQNPSSQKMSLQLQAVSSTPTSSAALAHSPSSHSQIPSLVHEVLASPGQRLNPATHQRMSSYFGQDFGGVQIHTGAKAARSARQVQAHAYTVGEHVVFGAERYTPDTRAGSRLLAHELTHVLQQRGESGSGGSNLEISRPDDGGEREADRIAESFETGSIPGDSSIGPYPLTTPVTTLNRKALMRDFDSTIQICQSYLKSRPFPVTNGAVSTEILATRGPTGGEGDNSGPDSQACGDLTDLHITLNRQENDLLLPDTELGTQLIPFGQRTTSTWDNLSNGVYYFTLWTNNTNPNCCVNGSISVRTGPPASNTTPGNTATANNQAGTGAAGSEGAGGLAQNLASLPTPLHFFHGTRWSVAQNIRTIEPRGIGDFARGFYTHFEPDNNEAAKTRARDRGRWASRQDPPEPYAGVLDFQVNRDSFVNLLNTSSRVFPLTDLNQPDYAQRQREWLDYITTHGREQDPIFFMDRFNVERWRHLELEGNRAIEPPQALTIGPFYTPLPGLPGPHPPRSEYAPKPLEPSQPTRLQQQVMWARDGIALLNASPRDTLQYDVETGDPVIPPIPASFSPPGGDYYTSQNPEEELVPSGNQSVGPASTPGSTGGTPGGGSGSGPGPDLQTYTPTDQIPQNAPRTEFGVWILSGISLTTPVGATRTAQVRITPEGGEPFIVPVSLRVVSINRHTINMVVTHPWYVAERQIGSPEGARYTFTFPSR